MRSERNTPHWTDVVFLHNKSHAAHVRWSQRGAARANLRCRTRQQEQSRRKNGDIAKSCRETLCFQSVISQISSLLHVKAAGTLRMENLSLRAGRGICRLLLYDFLKISNYLKRRLIYHLASLLFHRKGSW